ncbi:hypothetical protein DL96DRAFT_567355 [Flagelloscypha sp. PMI_526]|nr:hypothetical protein DL96DRAFT_567355 [Flagelloscypha sp. PMI_526]
MAWRCFIVHIFILTFRGRAHAEVLHVETRGIRAEVNGRGLGMEVAGEPKNNDISLWTLLRARCMSSGLPSPNFTVTNGIHKMAMIKQKS